MANQKLGQLGAVCGGGYLSTYSTVTVESSLIVPTTRVSDTLMFNIRKYRL
jgi:hypothetical protein